MIVLHFLQLESTQTTAMQISVDLQKYNISFSNKDELLNYLQSTYEDANIIDVGNASAICVMTDTQSAGFGRLNRAWQGISGNLFASFIFDKNNLQMQNHSLFAYYAAIAMLNALKQLYFTGSAMNFQMQLKWPNDILIDGKKVCGILTQTYGEHIICGAGVNVAKNPMIENAAYKSCCIADFVDEEDDFFVLSLQKLIDIFANNVQNLAGVQFVKICQMFCQNAYRINQEICININGSDGKICGIFSGINANGALQLLQKDGTITDISFGDVE